MFKNSSFLSFSLGFIINRFICLLKFCLQIRHQKDVVFISRLDDLGDAAIWCHTAPRLYQYYHNLNITVVFIGTPSYKVLAKHFKFYDEFITIPKTHLSFFALKSIVKIVFFNRILFFISPSYSRYLGQGYRRLAWMIPSKNKICDINFKHKNRLALILQMYLDKLIYNNITHVSIEPSDHELVFNTEFLFTITQNSSNRLQKYINRGVIETIAIFPGCKDDVRRWPTSHYVEVAKNLSLKGYCITMIFLPDEIDEGFDFTSLVGFTILTKISLDECVGEIINSDCIIGNDSGPIHVGNAFGKRTIALGWGGMYDRFLNYKSEPNYHLILENELCESCNCLSKQGLALCLKKIQCEDIYRVIDGFTE